jgi:hypothetical protein
MSSNFVIKRGHLNIFRSSDGLRPIVNNNSIVNKLFYVNILKLELLLMIVIVTAINF